MWLIETVETELVEGEHVFRFPSHLGEDEALVLVEQLSGEPGHLYATVENLPEEQHSRYERVKIFMGRIAEEAGEILLHIGLKTTELIRITVAKIRSGLAGAFMGLPCRLCKKLTGVLLTTALALVGVPYLDAEFAFDDDLIGRIQSLPDAFPTFGKLVHELDLGLWEAIIGVIGVVDFVFETLDKLYEKVCRQLHFCP